MSEVRESVKLSEMPPEAAYQDIKRRVENLLTAHGVKTTQKKANLEKWRGGKSGNDYSVILTTEENEREVSFQLGPQSWTFDNYPKTDMLNGLTYLKWSEQVDMDHLDYNYVLEYGDYNRSYSYKHFRNACPVDVFEKFDELLKDLETAPAQ